jgi:hypothetical protein
MSDLPGWLRGNHFQIYALGLQSWQKALWLNQSANFSRYRCFAAENSFSDAVGWPVLGSRLLLIAIFSLSAVSYDSRSSVPSEQRMLKSPW